ncbi:MAG: YggT family protein [Treponema sp.]|jgi:YggT family protein|nr:YggT family protein [Treponema sp.]
MVTTILSLLSAVVALYTMLCFVDIILSWIPGVKFTAFGRFISAICDPFMNLFSNIPFLRFGNIDFSPMISIGLLSIISSVLSGITKTGRIYFGGILASVIYMLWNVISSLGSLLLILFVIRLIVLLVNKNKTSEYSGWSQLDQILGNISYKVAKTFFKGNMTYTKSIVISAIVLAVFLLLGRFLIGILVNLCYAIPF